MVNVFPVALGMIVAIVIVVLSVTCSWVSIEPV